MWEVLRFLGGVMLFAIVVTIATSFLGPDAREVGVLLIVLVFLAGWVRFLFKPTGGQSARGIAASALHGRGSEARSGRPGLALALSAVAVGDLIWSEGIEAAWAVTPAVVAVVAVVAVFAIAGTAWGVLVLEAVALLVMLTRIFVEHGPSAGLLFSMVAMALVAGAFAFRWILGGST